jgi:hypothetical protein
VQNEEIAQTFVNLPKLEREVMVKPSELGHLHEVAVQCIVKTTTATEAQTISTSTEENGMQTISKRFEFDSSLYVLESNSEDEQILRQLDQLPLNPELPPLNTYFEQTLQNIKESAMMATAQSNETEIEGRKAKEEVETLRAQCVQLKNQILEIQEHEKMTRKTYEDQLQFMTEEVFRLQDSAAKTATQSPTRTNK